MGKGQVSVLLLFSCKYCENNLLITVLPAQKTDSSSLATLLAEEGDILSS